MADFENLYPASARAEVLAGTLINAVLTEANGNVALATAAVARVASALANMVDKRGAGA